MERQLHRIGLGRWVVVTRIEVKEPLRQRLRDIGMIPGTAVRCRYRTPDRKVTAIEFRGTVVALRTRDLQQIRVCG